MSASRSATDRWLLRVSFLVVSSANQRSTRLSQEAPVGVKWRTKRGWRSSQRWTTAQMVIAEEMGRAQIEAGLQAGSPMAAAIAAFYASYDGVQTRLVEARPAPWWLEGQTTGLAIETVAPSLLFTLPVERSATVVTADGIFAVRALTPSLPLGATP